MRSLTRSNKLFQVYFSDNYRLWDDFIITGTVHMWELLEALFYLKVSKFKGFCSIDFAPQCVDPTQACQIAIGNL